MAGLINYSALKKSVRPSWQCIFRCPLHSTIFMKQPIVAFLGALEMHWPHCDRNCMGTPGKFVPLP